VFEAFFVVGLRLPAHRFVVEDLRRFGDQIHQLTPNAMAALAKYVWAVSSYGGEPFVEVFMKNYCLHWQKRKIGGMIAQFGSCTFTPRTGNTSAEVIEIVLCAKNKWGNWWVEMAMGKYPPGITTPYPYPRHKNNPTGSPIYTGGYGFTPIPIPMWVWVTHRVTRTHEN
jgi:hypothetical protein